MVDRQRYHSVGNETVHAFYAPALAMVSRDDLQPVSPQHQNGRAVRAEETTKAQQFAIGLIG